MKKVIKIKFNNKYALSYKNKFFSNADIAIENQKILCKPSWLKIKLPTNPKHIQNIKLIIRKNNLHTVCEAASCPNLSECFNSGTATFMILGTICTRRCSFCNVTYGRPITKDINEPKKLAHTIAEMKLNYVVITSVNRDDLHDGGAQHFADCIRAIRVKNPNIRIEILVPDFRKCIDRSINIINSVPPDIFSHNLENVPRLYRQIRPGASYYGSLKLLEKFKIANPHLPTKSSLMLGLGETKHEIIEVMHNLYQHGVTMITLGQYLQPSPLHLRVKRYISPQEFNEIREEALSIGFTHASCGPLVRSSYHADLQDKGVKIK